VISDLKIDKTGSVFMVFDKIGSACFENGLVFINENQTWLL
jgi:hypothetical protein